MADHLAATYLDRAHDAERTILQLKLELHAAREEVKELEDTAATESAAHTQNETGLQRYLTLAYGQREELRSLLTEAKADHEAEVAGMWRHSDRVGAEKLVVEDENNLRAKLLGNALHEKDLAEADSAELKAENAELKEKLKGLEVVAPTSATADESHLRTAKEFLAADSAGCLMLVEVRNLRPIKAKPTSPNSPGSVGGSVLFGKSGGQRRCWEISLLSLDHLDDHTTEDGGTDVIEPGRA
ncbi:hypothetical protein LTR56_000477 [Elasticomyces elasticus]|nr:hypothetical protein LTR22_014205 [Elasticomyces elasticus]KAK3660719.1 hypothetical protein LTR56_000477 [Elasticomyces elasticus]KAK4922865.1 hypothetical protein LTR49_009872 [Elasticomyces elasticus]KAK5759759.1 hypothetical protein LTS12_010099 [Elasticomyces elasticus]